MKRREVFSYEDRFDLVLSYVYEHLDQPLDLIRLAEVAGMSARHWHRIFSAAFGESLPALVKRVRLQRAVALLADNVPIAEVATQCGYPNVSSFTRTFRSAVGVTPGEYREHGTHVDLRIARIANDPQRYRVREVELASTRCVAFRHRGSFFTIDRAFHDLRIWLLAHDMDLDACDMYGVYLSDPSRTDEGKLESLACVAVPESFAPDLLPLSPDASTPLWYSLRPGPYAVLTHQGAYADMPESYAWLFGCWLPASGHVLTDDPVLERYLSPAHGGTPTTVRTDLLLPLRAA
ncbi:AraC family transcriptional regulator [Brachybacterium tyrofermentans]|uniref:AraC family transcriptional regulator n=1 Tax=Brachybacterium tyrofermentans TaxID=47848 RepID=UPI003FCF155B